jgi:hypothetical protein
MSLFSFQEKLLPFFSIKLSKDKNTMATKQITFTAKNVKPFVSWLKKFSSINNSLMIEVDEPTSTFISKTYNDERSVVKLSKIKFDDAGFVLKPSKEPKRIKVGILNIPRLIKIIDQFGNDDFTFVINYDEVIGETTELAGTSLLFKTKDLKVTDDCTSLSIFKYISDDKFKDTIAAMSDPIAEFTLLSDNIQKINSLSVLDNDNKFLEFSVKDDKVTVSGKAFELDVAKGSVENDGKIDIFKEQFNNVDVESYNVKMGEDRLVFISTDSETTTVVSMVERDDA